MTDESVGGPAREIQGMERHRARPHPTDNFALVCGIAGLVAGFFALMHQGGAITLGPTAVIAIAVLIVGIGGVAYAALEVARR